MSDEFWPGKKREKRPPHFAIDPPGCRQFLDGK